MLFYAAVCVAASCAIASYTATACRTFNSKVGSPKTDTEVVKSNKWFVIIVVFLEFADIAHVRGCCVFFLLLRLPCFVRLVRRVMDIVVITKVLCIGIIVDTVVGRVKERPVK